MLHVAPEDLHPGPVLLPGAAITLAWGHHPHQLHQCPQHGEMEPPVSFPGTPAGWLWHDSPPWTSGAPETRTPGRRGVHLDRSHQQFGSLTWSRGWVWGAPLHPPLTSGLLLGTPGLPDRIPADWLSLWGGVGEEEGGKRRE